jgi:hypothetical protein
VDAGLGADGEGAARALPALAVAATLVLASGAAAATCPGQCQTIASSPLVVKTSADTAL